MSNFIVKYQNGEIQKFECAAKSGKDNITEYEFSKNIDYTKVSYVEAPLHDFPINARDDGFFLLPSGL